MGCGSERFAHLGRARRSGNLDPKALTKDSSNVPLVLPSLLTTTSVNTSIDIC